MSNSIDNRSHDKYRVQHLGCGETQIIDSDGNVVEDPSAEIRDAAVDPRGHDTETTVEGAE